MHEAMGSTMMQHVHKVPYSIFKADKGKLLINKCIFGAIIANPRHRHYMIVHIYTAISKNKHYDFG